MSAELVVVCCHAICTNSLNPYQESSWALKPFQRSDSSTAKSGEHETFLLHIQAGVNALRKPRSVLVFSGAKTEPDVPLSEAKSYHDIFVQHFAHSDIISQAIADGRVACEEAATDSCQNLLFSLIKYYEIKKEWPEMITVITHSFKETRFLECHAQAICWPSNRIRVQGINPPFPLAELREVQRFEEATVDLFKDDPYGANVPLSAKRAARQWDDSIDVIRGLSDEATKRMLQRFLGWKDRAVFPEPLPWVATSSCDGAQSTP